MEVIKVALPLIFLCFLVFLVIDLLFKSYKYKNIFINWSLVLIMIFGHPLYFGFSVFISYISTGANTSNKFSVIGYLMIILCAVIFAFLRYKIYLIIQLKSNSLIELFQYSKFYVFTTPISYLYISVINEPLEFYMVYLIQLYVPALVIFVFLYSLIKIVMFRLINKGVKDE